MGEIYSENLVSKELARCIGEYFDKASSTLPYSKGYKGVVKTVLDGAYEVEISGKVYTIKSGAALAVGDYVTVMSLQNQNHDLTIMPTGSTGGASYEYISSTGTLRIR